MMQFSPLTGIVTGKKSNRKLSVFNSDWVDIIFVIIKERGRYHDLFSMIKIWVYLPNLGALFFCHLFFPSWETFALGHLYAIFVQIFIFGFWKEKILYIISCFLTITLSLSCRLTFLPKMNSYHHRSFTVNKHRKKIIILFFILLCNDLKLKYLSGVFS